MQIYPCETGPASIVSQMTLCDLVHVVGGRLDLAEMPPAHGELSTIGRIVTDSRRVRPGDVFWAVGQRGHSGEQYAYEAYGRGASGVVTTRVRIVPWPGTWSAQVDNAMASLTRLARSVRKRLAGRVIFAAVNDRDVVTCELIQQVLGSRYMGSPNQPLIAHGTDIAVSILGWSHDDDYAMLPWPVDRRERLGELDEWVGISRPDIVVAAHTAPRFAGDDPGEETVESWPDRLLPQLPENSSMIVAGDDMRIGGTRFGWEGRGAIRAVARVVRRGLAESTELVATDIGKGQGCWRFRVGKQSFQVPTRCDHDLVSALAAIGVGMEMGLPIEVIAEALEGSPWPPKSCQLRPLGGVSFGDADLPRLAESA